MKVLWLVNRILPMFYTDLGIKETNFGGGWLTGLLNALVKNEDIELAVSAPMNNISKIMDGKTGGVSYFFYPEKNVRNYDAGIIPYFQEISARYEPDVIHIFGTEYPRTLEMIDAVGADRILISLTGILTEYLCEFRCDVPEQYFKKHAPLRAISKIHPKLRFLCNRLLSYMEDDFKSRAVFEIQSVKKAKYVSGRTTFDKTFAKRENPGILYFFCNESLRESFYTYRKWDYRGCQPHSIFISNAGYPIKGFHKVIEACGRIKQFYPDMQIYVAGNSPFSGIPGIKGKLIEVTDEYAMYLRKLTKENDLFDRIHYLGNLDEKGMAERFLDANVFVLPSSAENSPNSLGEAMLLGVPCIASNVGGVAEMMLNEEEGLVYPYHDVSALANAIRFLFDNPPKAAEFGRNAIAHAEMTHDPEKNSAEMKEIYTSIVRENQQ